MNQKQTNRTTVYKKSLKNSLKNINKNQLEQQLQKQQIKSININTNSKKSKQ